MIRRASPYFTPETHAREAHECEHCRQRGLPWMRLTAAEQEQALTMILSSRGHTRLRWQMPREPWPLGAVWPEPHLWGVPVDRPYRTGPVRLTARRTLRRRYVRGVLRW